MALLPEAANSRAVLIGTSRYTHLSSLPAVANNLPALATALRAPSSWELAEEHCTVIANPGDWTEVLRAVRTAAEEASDTLLVYYSGHGLLEETRGDLFLGLPRSEQGRSYTGLPYSALRDVLLTARSRRHVVILDCCFSGRALGTMSGPASIADQAEIEGSYLLAASPETSFALAPEGETHTAFTGELLRVLNVGVPDGPDLLDLDTVYHVMRTALRAKGRPLPQKRDRNTAGRLALSRNAARASAGTDADGDRDHIAFDAVRADPFTSNAAAGAGLVETAEALPRRGRRWRRGGGTADGAKRPGPARRRWFVAVATVVVVAAVSGGIRLWASSRSESLTDGGDKNTAGKSTPGWEIDLAKLGAPNALKSGFRCAAATDGDLLCTGSSRGVLKLNAATGKERWRYQGSGSLAWSERTVVEHDGSVYALARQTGLGEGKGIVALDPATGRVKRTYEVPDPRRFAVTDSGVLVQNGARELRRFNAKSPRTQSRWKTDADEIAGVTSNGKQVVVSTYVREGKEYASRIELTNSSISEHLSVGIAVSEAPRFPLEFIGRGTSHSALYLAEEDPIGHDYAAADRFDPSGIGDTSKPWLRVPLKTPTDLPMTASDDFVYAPASDGTITAVDCRRDRVAWRKDSQARGISEVAVHDGKLLLSDAQGRLHTLDAITGRHLSTGKPYRGSVDADPRFPVPAPVVIGKAVYVVTPGNTLYRTPLPGKATD
ncbi:PQQ-binding-like beta-propeller repeat protein [Streptomyces sp. MS1.AVA.3]|uniref:caspase, EACC1-associated type n=1 Tax=Streptomyces decoyicus TaxID=249567 RepID=UPI0030C19886